MNVKKISLYRQEIMGFAILQVILFHSNIDFKQSTVLALFGIVKETGYLGVDIFFFLSGFSLTHGWLCQRYKLFHFYKKRFLRIIPSFTIITLFSIICFFLTAKNNFSLSEAVSRTGIGFMLAKNYDWWFVPAISFCYGMFPFLVKLIQFFLVGKTYRSYIYLLLLILFFPGFICLTLIVLGKNVLLILFARVPNFVLGIVIGLLLSEREITNRSTHRKVILKNMEILACIMTIIGLILLKTGVAWMPREFAFNYGFLWYPFIFLTFPIILLLVGVFKVLEQTKERRITSLFFKLLSASGGLSYELFLAHGFLIYSSDVYDRFFDSVRLLSLLNTGRYIEYLLVFAVSFLFAIALKKSNILIDNQFQKYKIL